MSITIEQDLKDILNKIDGRLERLEGGINDLKIGQVRLEEKLDGLEKRTEERFDNLEKRSDSVEFINRGIFIGLIVTILGGAAKLFGWVGSP
jgi:predicted nuclease with TOPRIM domain